MSTQCNQVIEFPTAVVMGDGQPLPEFCGPTPDFVPYVITPAKLLERARWRRKYLYGRVAFYRIQANRGCSIAAASFYAARAAMFTRSLRPIRHTPPAAEANDLRDEIKSWLVMADTIAREAHLTAEDYLYA